MSRYALNLPLELKKEAEELASQQGISLNQFIMWSVSEKVASLRQSLDDPNFPGITYRKGASGWVSPVIRGTGIRVQTIANHLSSGMQPEQIAVEYEVDLRKIKEAQAFYNVHKKEIDTATYTDEELENNIE
ncbi:MAG TPA: DUF433 domain-containing protein [Anaerolineaceae bacterium]|nr:DUF433 domain-containing protein [Anaerolineaceae bacterium]